MVGVRILSLYAALVVSIAATGWFVSQTIYAEEEKCSAYSTWSNPAVCGYSSDRVFDPLVGTIYFGMSDVYGSPFVEVHQYLVWARTYNNHGGWHLVDSKRKPASDEACHTSTSCTEGADYAPFLFSPTAIMGYYDAQGNVYECNTWSCYGTTRSKFFDPPGPTPLRDHYTSHDGAHSSYACWESSTPGC